MTTTEETNNSRQGKTFAGSVSLICLHDFLVKSVQPLHWVILGREARQVEQVRVRFHRFEGENLGALSQYETNTQKGDARKGKARQGKARLGEKDGA